MPYFEIKPFEVPKTEWIATERRRDAVGQGFEIGLTFGTAYNFAKGYYSSSLGQFRAGLNYACAKSIRTCSSLAGLFFVYAVVDNAVTYNLQRESTISTFASAATAAAIASARRGPLFCSLSVIGFGGSYAVMHHIVMKWDAQTAEENTHNN